MNFGQVLTAMVTPFNHNNEVDFNATRTLVNYLIANGSDGLVIAGTTGESPTLTAEEKVDLFKFVGEVVDGRVPVIAGTGSNNTKASISLTRQAEAQESMELCSSPHTITSRLKKDYFSTLMQLPNQHHYR